MQITAVTKSGTNRFRGSVYDVERNSDWNANSRTNILNGDPKTVLRQREWGYSIGGPIGKPGGTNKLFFFYTQEFEPRTGGNDKTRFRVPTALERAGDFSQSTDNNGNPYPYIKNPALSGPCTAANQSGCYADGGVLGRIPASALYQTGLNILKSWPLPNISNVPPGQQYNFELTRPSESILSTQPAMRFDYQPLQSLRASFKYSGFSQREQTQQGSIPGWNDTRMVSPHVGLIASTINYTWKPTLFLEGTIGHSLAYQGGCFGVGSGGGPQFCNAFPTVDNSNRFNTGLGDLPFIFPEANVIDNRYFIYDLLNRSGSPMWDGTRVLLPADFCVWQPHQQQQPELRAAQYRVPKPEHRVEHRRGGELDESVGETHGEDRRLHAIQQQAAGAGWCCGRTGPELPAGQRRHQSMRYVLRILQCGDRLLQLVRARLERRRGKIHLLQRRRVRAGQLEGEPEPHA